VLQKIEVDREGLPPQSEVDFLPGGLGQRSTFIGETR
jgi:hypothetical protein